VQRNEALAYLSPGAIGLQVGYVGCVLSNVLLLLALTTASLLPLLPLLLLLLLLLLQAGDCARG
jgi:hypothetical protein